MLALQGEIENAGGTVVTRTPFSEAEPLEVGGFRVLTGGDDPFAFQSTWLISASGLAAQDVAESIKGYPEERIPVRHLGKGNYVLFNGAPPFTRLVYPLPIKGALGTHYRRDLGGQGRFGPDLHFVDTENYTVEDDRLPLFYQSIRRYWPTLPDNALSPDYVGIRPKIHGPDEPMTDFRIDTKSVHGIPGLVTLFGIESPGLTASLALGEFVADLCGQ